jgi:hypothetical protein|tara:strand:- start:43 stop:372 length:330 start_codon:yes stop_codon:yes gene_type:complete
MTNPPMLQIPQDAKELYNSIMVEIEPDLVTDELPKLSEKYQNESVENLKARGKRYYQAFQTFKKALASKAHELDGKADALDDFVMEALEHLSREQDNEDCNHIEQYLSS